MRGKFYWPLITALLLFYPYNSFSAQENEVKEKGMSLQQFINALSFKQGKIKLPGNAATIVVPDTFKYLDPTDTEKVLVQAWGNPDGSGTLGMIFPADSDIVGEKSWGIVITYEEDGYVSDKDANDINYDDLLTQMQKETEKSNTEREKKGYDSIKLIGWAQRPFYEKSEHKLYWAKELMFGQDRMHTLNYNIRVLGRKGVLVMNAVAEMDQLSMIKKRMPEVMEFTSFNQGYRYEEYNSKTDKKAAYGLAALVAGGIAAKVGLFGKLFALILAAKKLIIIVILAISGTIAKWFKRK